MNFNLANSIIQHKATCLLVATNILVFAIYGLSGADSLDLLDLGANFPPFSLSNEPHRLISSMFLHGGVIHLIANMYSLCFLGFQCEKKLGTLHFIEIYFLAGVAGGLASLNFNLFSISVGASGAIFGLYGYLLIDALVKENSNRTGIIINFVLYLVVVTAIGSQFHFDNAGHFGGVAAGILLGISDLLLKAKWSPVVFVVVLGLIFLSTSKHQVHYFRAFQTFLTADKKVTNTFNARLSDQEFYEALLKIENAPDSAIWEFRKLSYVPTELQKDTSFITAYLLIRNQQIDYFLKGLSKESYIYIDSIAYLGSHIDTLPRIRYSLNLDRELPSADTVVEVPEKLRFVRQHYDEEWLETDSSDYTFYRLGQKDSLDDWHGRVEDYYESGAIQMKGSYDRGLKHGIFIYYSEDSTYESAGRYARDERIGKWEEYHKNGRLASEIRHEDGFSYVENVWDSTGNAMITDRQGEELYKFPNGVISFRRSIKDGLNDGFVEAYHKNGDLFYREYYESGKLVKGVSYADNTQNVYDASSYFPYPAGGYEAFYDYIDRANLLKSDSINEFVVIRFDVHYSGELHNIRFLKRYNPEFDEFAKNLLLKGPQWNPAKSRGLYEISTDAEITVRF